MATRPPQAPILAEETEKTEAPANSINTYITFIFEPKVVFSLLLLQGWVEGLEFAETASGATMSLYFPPLPNHRRQPLEIPEDTADATATVVEWIKCGGASPERSSAVEAFNQRIARLTSPDPAVLIQELAGHAAVLQALAERWAVESISSTSVEAKARFGKLHLQAQAACMKTLLTIKALQAKGAVVTIHDEAEEKDA